MPAVRVKTASGWQDVAIQGPQGPGGLLWANSVRGANEGYSGTFTAGASPLQLWADLAGTIPIRLNYTPPVDAWLDVTLNVGLVGKTDAAYHYMYANLKLTPNDVDGQSNAYHYLTQHASVQQYDHRSLRRMYKLAANTAYQVDGQIGVGSGGTWQYFQGAGQLFMDARAWPRNVPTADPTKPPLVTSFPGSPFDGQEIYYLADATNGIIWHLRYRATAASAYKWEAASRPQPLYSFSAGSFVHASTGSETAFSPGPSITAPRAGDYMVAWGVRGEANTASGGWYEVRPKIGAAAVAVDDAITQFFQGNAAGQASGATHQQSRRINVPTAGTAITLVSNHSGAAVAYIRNSMELTPIRVA